MRSALGFGRRSWGDRTPKHSTRASGYYGHKQAHKGQCAATEDIKGGGLRIAPKDQIMRFIR